MISSSTARAVAALALALACAPPGAAQSAARLQPELRLDALTGDPWAVHAGLGVTAPLGTYVRVGVVQGAGGGEGGFSGRTDLVARFTFDPFRDRRWAPYAAGGVSARYGRESRTDLVLLAGAEGPARRGLAPAVEFGFGGGFRAGVILRRAFPRRR
ncbi:MAG: hypothetical protein ACR2L6_13055 [Gemmatimonadaceae bacterium]